MEIKSNTTGIDPSGDLLRTDSKPAMEGQSLVRLASSHAVAPRARVRIGEAEKIVSEVKLALVGEEMHGSQTSPRLVRRCRRTRRLKSIPTCWKGDGQAETV